MRTALGVVLVGIVVALAAVLETPEGSRSDPGCFTDFSEGITGHSGAVHATADEVWFGEFTEDTLGTIDPDSGRATEFRLPEGSAPRALTSGPDGEIWFASMRDQIGRFDPRTRRTRLFGDGITPGSAPHGIVLAPDGNVYFAEDNGARLGRLDPRSGAIRELATGLPRGGPLVGLAVDPDGDHLWTAQQENDRVVRFDIARQRFDRTLQFPRGSGPHDVVVLGGKAFVALQGSGHIGEYDLSDDSLRAHDVGLRARDMDPMPPLSVVEVAIGPDEETIYATSFQANRVFRLDPDSGRVTEPCIFEPGNSSAQIVAGPGGKMWFSNPIGGSILRIDEEE